MRQAGHKPGYLPSTSDPLDVIMFYAITAFGSRPAGLPATPTQKPQLAWPSGGLTSSSRRHVFGQGFKFGEWPRASGR